MISLHELKKRISVQKKEQPSQEYPIRVYINYEKVRKLLLEELKCSEKDVNSLSLSIKRKGRQAHSLGSVNFLTKKVEIYTDNLVEEMERVLQQHSTSTEGQVKEKLEKTTLNTLAHELQHFKDRGFILPLSFFTKLGLVGLSSISQAAFLINEFSGSDGVKVMWTPEATLIIGMLILGMQLTTVLFLVAVMYEIDPAEIRARRFAEKIAQNPDYQDLLRIEILYEDADF